MNTARNQPTGRAATNQMMAPAATGASAPPQNFHAPAVARRRKGLMMPIYAGAAVVLLVMIVAPVWFIMSGTRTTSVRPTATSPNLGNSNRSANTNQTSTSGSLPKTLTNNVGIEFVYVPSGTFMMGSTNGGDDEKPAHQVTITRPFYMAKYEVTQAQWQAVMGNNPSHYKGDKSPVEQVSWNDANAFIARLNSRNDGYTYRLPTEAEWEYAARAGTTTTYYWGDDETQACRYANVGDQTAKAKYPDAELIECVDGYADSSPVGSFQPNSFGLYDMTGNVSEWCQDWYGENSYRSSPGSDPQGPGGGQDRVLRGGSFGRNTSWLPSASRNYGSPNSTASNFGFRVAAVPRIQ